MDYFNKRIHNMLRLKPTQIPDLSIKITNAAIERFRQLKSEPVSVILLNHNSDIVTDWHHKCTWEVVLDQIKLIYPECRYHVREMFTDVVRSQSELVDVTSSFNRCWDTKDRGCYLMSGNKWDRLVQGEKFYQDKEIFKFYPGGLMTFFDLKEYKNVVSSWVIDTLNDDQFITQQNALSNIL